MAYFGLIEGGGTKFNVAIADGSDAIIATHRVPTATPDETLSACSDWFKAQSFDLEAIGIGCFGPLDVDKSSIGWGCITRTTKPYWSGSDIAGYFKSHLDCPVGIETDVDGAALGESRWGAGKGYSSLLYLTIGTGVGGGFAKPSGLLRGLTHPEMGHIRLPRHPDDLRFAGNCPFHGDCLEGLASGPAIAARWGRSLSDPVSGSAEKDMIAWYLGQAICTFQAIMEPERIVLGGGVMNSPGLIEKVRVKAAEAGAGYFRGDPQKVIVAPGLGDRSGLMGALAIAQAAALSPRTS
jgi:fructokinase